MWCRMFDRVISYWHVLTGLTWFFIRNLWDLCEFLGQRIVLRCCPGNGLGDHLNDVARGGKL